MNLLFHHVGLACRSLDAETRRLASLNYKPIGKDFTDVTQGVNGRFLCGGGPQLELLTPISDNSVLSPWLSANVKLYHLAYEAPDFEAAIAGLRAEGAKTVVQPVPAVAFGGRRISFLILPNMLVIELIETK